jgi:hypothetical protein
MPSSRSRWSAVATVRTHTPRLPGDRRIGRVQLAGAVVQEVEDQRVEHLQRGVPDGSAVSAWPVRAAVEIACPVRGDGRMTLLGFGLPCRSPTERRR